MMCVYWNAVTTWCRDGTAFLKWLLTLCI